MQKILHNSLSLLAKVKWLTVIKYSLMGIGFFIIATIIINITVNNSAQVYIYSQANSLPKAQAVMILGALVRPDGSLSDMLYDRAITAIDIYNAKKVDKILVSGDHGRRDYDEVNAIKRFLLDKGVPKEDIFLDHAGFDTYDSMYRARDIFQIKSLIIVTQDFHLPRAVYIARNLGVEAYGYKADRYDYQNVWINYLREIPAKDKAWLDLTTHVYPKYLGSAIPITGDSQLSWD